MRTAAINTLARLADTPSLAHAAQEAQHASHQAHASRGPEAIAAHRNAEKAHMRAAVAGMHEGDIGARDRHHKEARAHAEAWRTSRAVEHARQEARHWVARYLHLQTLLRDYEDPEFAPVLAQRGWKAPEHATDRIRGEMRKAWDAMRPVDRTQLSPPP